MSDDSSSITANSIGKSEGNNNKFPTFFQWKDGGNEVYITGTFSNWTQKNKIK